MWRVQNTTSPNNKESDGRSNTVEVIDNHIYFYSEVTRDSVLKLIKDIKTLNKKLHDLAKQYKIKSPPIVLHINSDGGSVFQGFAAVDAIVSSKIPVHTIVEGSVASAGTLMSIAGKKRFMTSNSCMLIHEVHHTFWGKYGEFKDELSNLDTIMKMILDHYRKYAKIPEEEIEQLLKRDMWWQIDKCIDYGLIDKKWE